MTTKCNDKIAEFLKANYKGKTNQELTEMVNKTFNRTLKESSIKRYKNLYHLKSGNDTKYKIKYFPNEEKNVQGYIKIKVHSHLWVQKSRVIWEQKNGKIPKGYKIIHLDGNALNDDIDNLACISNEELGGLRHYGKKSNNVELTKTQILTVRLKNAIKNKRGKSCQI